MSRALRLTAGAVAIAAPAGGVVVARRSDAVTSYGALGTADLIAGLAAGAALGAVACLVLAGRDRRAVGWAAAAAAVALAGPEWAGWEGGPPLVRSVGELFGPGMLLLAVGAGVAGRRWLLPAAVVIGSLTLVRALVRDPFTAADCWRNCSDNVFAVAADADVAATVRVLLNVAVAIAAAALAVVAAHGWRAGGRAFALPVAAVIAVTQLLLALDPSDGPERTGMRELWLASNASLVVYAAGLARRPLGLLRRRRRIGALARELAGDAGTESVAGRLARDLRDPSLRVAFPDGEGGWIDEEGGRTAPPAEAPRAVARIMRSGRLVAAIEYEPSALDPWTLARQIGPAARMALENGGLRAQLVARLDELTAVRRRIVEDGDRARRTLERMLHDGAQQALVSLLIDLRHAAEDDPAAAAAAAEVQQALGELREIAHGIFPTVLAEDGVVAAVDVLIDTADLAVTDEMEDVRLPAPMEVAAYRLFAQALAVPGERATLGMHVSAGQVTIKADMSGVDGGRLELEEVEDRFAALHGSLVVERAGDRLQVHGRLPLDPAAAAGGGWAA